MIYREMIKREIDNVDDKYLVKLYKIIKIFESRILWIPICGKSDGKNFWINMPGIRLMIRLRGRSEGLVWWREALTLMASSESKNGELLGYGTGKRRS